MPHRVSLCDVITAAGAATRAGSLLSTQRYLTFCYAETTGSVVTRHLVVDPRLPSELLPATWPGDDC